MSITYSHVSCSGTEVSFSTAQDFSGLLPEILCFLKKVVLSVSSYIKDCIFLLKVRNDMIPQSMT